MAWASLKGGFVLSSPYSSQDKVACKTRQLFVLHSEGLEHGHKTTSGVFLHSLWRKKVEWGQDHSSELPWVLQRLCENLLQSSILPCERKRRCWRESPTLSLQTQVGNFHCRQTLELLTSFDYICAQRQTFSKASNQMWEKFPGSCKIHITTICRTEQRKKKGKPLCWISSVIFKGPPCETVIGHISNGQTSIFLLLLLWSNQLILCTL